MIGYLILLILVVYLLPGIIALIRRHPEASQIAITNLLLGWSILFWVVAFRHAVGLDTIERPEDSGNERN